MRKFILKLVLVASIIAAGFGVAASGAGAAPQPCPGGINGWFDAMNDQGVPYVVNCSIDYANGIHVVTDLHRGSSVSHGVWDFWFNATCSNLGFYSSAGTSARFRIVANDFAGNFTGCKWDAPGFNAVTGPLANQRVYMDVLGSQCQVTQDNNGWFDLDKNGWNNGPLNANTWIYNRDAAQQPPPNWNVCVNAFHMAQMSATG